MLAMRCIGNRLKFSMIASLFPMSVASLFPISVASLFPMSDDCLCALRVWYIR